MSVITKSGNDLTKTLTTPEMYGILTTANALYSTGGYSDFATILTTIGANDGTILVDSAVTIAADTTIPANVSVQVIKSGSFAVDTDKTLTINGSFSCGLFQCFSGAGSVVFGSGAVSEVIPQWWGAKGDGVATNEQIAINAAFVCALASSQTVTIPAGTYLTGAPIYTRVPFRGADGFSTKIKPQGTFAAFDVYECSNGSIENLYIDYTDVGQANITTACIGLRLMNNAPSAAVQVANTSFRNIYIYRCYLGIAYQYNGTTTFGQLWMVSFEHITVNSPKGVGFYLDCSSGTLNVSFSQCVMEGSYGLDPWNWSSSQGFYLKNIINLSMDCTAVARVQCSSYGMVGNFQSIHTASIRGFQIEGTNISAAVSPIYFATCDGVTFDGDMQTSTFSTVAPYLYFDANMENVVINNLNEVGAVTGSASRRFIGCNATNPNLSVQVMDNTVTRSLCTIATTIRNAFYFVSDRLGLDNEPQVKQQFTWYSVTSAGVASSIQSLPAFGSSAAPTSGLYLVAGSSSLDNSKGFMDVVAVGGTAGGTQGVAVVSTNNLNSYAYARTYSIASNTLKVSIPTDVCYINVTGLAQTGLT